MIEIKNLTKIYNKSKRAVDNLSLKINSGEIFAFIGPNGAGKTTTIKCLMGILNFEEGEILIDHKSLKNEPLNCKKIMAYLREFKYFSSPSRLSRHAGQCPQPSPGMPL